MFPLCGTSHSRPEKMSFPHAILIMPSRSLRALSTAKLVWDCDPGLKLGAIPQLSEVEEQELGIVARCGDRERCFLADGGAVAGV